jgi:EpsI family protein
VKVAAAIAFLLLNLYVYHRFASQSVHPPRQSFDRFPLVEGEWSCERPELMDVPTVRNLGVSDYHLCNWTRRAADGDGDAAPVMPVQNLYVGYHASQVREEGGGSGENSIHPPAHCLPGPGWDIIRLETVDADLPGLPQSPARVRRLLIAKGNERQLVYYWYQGNGRVIAEDWLKILYLGWDRAWRSRTDGALVRFTIPVAQGDEEAAERAFRELAPRITPHLAAYVPE